MTGPEHYRKAEKLAGISLGQEPALAAVNVALAQVHATLALAAATALNDAEGGMHGRDYHAWRDLVGVKPDSASAS